MRTQNSRSGARQPTVRLRDVARESGLSVAAVSRFLNGTLDLPPDTARRIKEAVALLNYRPNPHARRLSRGRTDTIGLIVPDIANPFFALLVDAVERAAEERGTDLLVCATRNRLSHELHELSRLGRDYADGLLFVTNHADDGALAQAIGDVGKVVLLDEDVPGVEAPRVFAENYRGGVLAAEHLLAAGHRRLAFLGGPRGLLSTVERFSGFAETVRSSGSSAQIVFESYDDYGAAQGQDAAERMLQAAWPATAAFATSDETALGVLAAARKLSVRLPTDLSLVAFDDVGPLHLLSPPLTAIRQPVAEIGSCGVGALLDHIAGQPVPEQPRRVPVELIERASVATPSRPRSTTRNKAVSGVA
ncbi:LacI family DNA-binding transcriptional regulator [Roseomonas elaeocarpi]|uniref:LacI family DNA-binding transcriptional regulator n=1 Tax=Roseomonas elaeocarpi TaxID=907779 RepID=A0ABV6JP01_9PROT